MTPTRKRELLVVAIVAALGLTVFAPAEPPVGGGWGAVLGAALAGAVGLGGVALGWYGGSLLWIGLSLRDRDPDAVVHATEGGHVNIEGTARPHGETLTAPVTGADCLAHRYNVQSKQTATTEGIDAGPDDTETVTDTETDTTWASAAKGAEVVPFRVETNAGTVLVGNDDPRLKLMDDRTQVVVGGDEDPPDPIRAFLSDPELAAAEGSRIDLSDVDTSRTLRYTETLLTPGETVFVMGTATGRLDANRAVPDDVDALIGAPAASGPEAYLPDRLWPFDFFVADKPMDETVRAMRWVGALALGVAVAAVAGAVVMLL